MAFDPSRAVAVADDFNPSRAVGVDDSFDPSRAEAIDDGPAHASLSSGFDTSLNLPDVQSLDRSYGGLDDTEAHSGNSFDPILRALPVSPRQKVQLDMEGVDPYAEREQAPAEPTLAQRVLAALGGL